MDEGSPKKDDPSPKKDEGSPKKDEASPKKDEGFPKKDEASPKMDEGSPKKGRGSPQETDDVSTPPRGPPARPQGSSLSSRFEIGKAGAAPRGRPWEGRFQGFWARSPAGSFTLLVSGCQATLTIHQRWPLLKSWKLVMPRTNGSASPAAWRTS